MDKNFLLFEIIFNAMVVCYYGLFVSSEDTTLDQTNPHIHTSPADSLSSSIINEGSTVP